MRTMACMENLTDLVTLAQCLVDIMIIISCTSIAIIIYRNRDCFHPFFCTLFSLFLLSYAISDVFEIVRFITAHYSLGKTKFLEAISEFFYFYASPCAVLLLIERFVASCYTMQYEKARPWKIFWLAQPICLLISGGVIYSAKFTVHSEDDIQTAILFVIQVLIAVMTVLLLIYNRWRTKKSLGTGTKLSTRYQLAENIRVLKILLPVIVCDLSMTICDISSRVMYEIADEINCSNHVFGLFYVIFKFLSFLSQLCIPFSVFLSHPVFRRIRKIGSALHVRSRNNHRMVIRSVLGTTINGGQTADNYFSSLQRRWEND